MINTKEQMEGTWIKNDNGALREAFHKKAVELGLHKPNIAGDLPPARYNSPFISCVSGCSVLQNGKHGSKELILSDFYMTVEDFLEKGYKFVDGDVYIGWLTGDLYTVGKQGCTALNVNRKGTINKDLFVKSAKALTKKTKVEYVQMDFNSVGEAVQQVFNTQGKGVYYFKDQSTGTYVEAEYQDTGWYWKKFNLYKKVETPLEWYEDIPPSGILCWCSDALEGKKYMILITYFDANSEFHYKAGLTYWKYATPLTKLEIQTFLDNAPE